MRQGKREASSGRRTVPLAALLLLALGVTGTAAQPGRSGEAATASTGAPQELRWILRGKLLGMLSTGDEAGVVTFDPEPLAVTRMERGIDDAVGLGLEIEYLVSRRIGIELAALAGEFGADIQLEADGMRLTDTGDIGFTAVSVGVNYHFTPGARADFFAGASVQRSFWDDVDYRFPQAATSARLRLDDDVGYGVKVGMDRTLRSDGPWVFSAALRHLRGPLDIKPIILSVGAGYRF